MKKYLTLFLTFLLVTICVFPFRISATDSEVNSDNFSTNEVNNQEESEEAKEDSSEQQIMDENSDENTQIEPENELEEDIEILKEPVTTDDFSDEILDEFLDEEITLDEESPALTTPEDDEIEFAAASVTPAQFDNGFEICLPANFRTYGEDFTGLKYNIVVYNDNQTISRKLTTHAIDHSTNTSQRCLIYTASSLPDIIQAFKNNKKITISESISPSENNRKPERPPFSISGNALDIFTSRTSTGRPYVVPEPDLTTQNVQIASSFFNNQTLINFYKNNYTSFQDESENKIVLFYMYNIDPTFFNGALGDFDAKYFTANYMYKYTYSEINEELIKKELRNYLGYLVDTSYNPEYNHSIRLQELVDSIYKLFFVVEVPFNSELAQIPNYAEVLPSCQSAILLGIDYKAPWLDETIQPNVVKGALIASGTIRTQPFTPGGTATIKDLSVLRRININLQPYNIHQLSINPHEPIPDRNQPWDAAGESKEFINKLIYSSFSNYKHLFHEDIPQSLIDQLTIKYPFIVLSDNLLQRMQSHAIIKEMNEDFLSLIDEYTSPITGETKSIITLDKLVPFLIDKENLTFYTLFRDPSNVNEYTFQSGFINNDENSHIYIHSQLEDLIELNQLENEYPEIYNLEYTKYAATDRPLNSSLFLHSLYFTEKYDSISVEKVWDDNDNYLELRPDTISLDFTTDKNVHEVYYPVITADVPDISGKTLFNGNEIFAEVYNSGCNITPFLENYFESVSLDLGVEPGGTRTYKISKQNTTECSGVSLLSKRMADAAKHIAKSKIDTPNIKFTLDNIPIIFQIGNPNDFQEAKDFTGDYFLNIYNLIVKIDHLLSIINIELEGNDSVDKQMLINDLQGLKAYFDSLKILFDYSSTHFSYTTTQSAQHLDFNLEGNAETSLIKMDLNDYISLVSELFYESSILEDIHYFVVDTVARGKAERDIDVLYNGDYSKTQEIMDNYLTGALKYNDLIEFSTYMDSIPIEIQEQYNNFHYSTYDFSEMITLLNDIYMRYYKLEKFPSVVITTEESQLPDNYLSNKNNNFPEFISKFTTFNKLMEDVEFSQDNTQNKTKENFRVPVFSDIHLREDQIQGYTSAVQAIPAEVLLEDLKLWPVISSDTGELLDLKLKLPINASEDLMGYVVIKNPRIFVQASIEDKYTKHTFSDVIFKLDKEKSSGEHIYKAISYSKFKEEWDSWIDSAKEGYFLRRKLSGCRQSFSECMSDENKQNLIKEYLSGFNFNFQFDLDIITNRGDLFIKEYKLHTDSSEDDSVTAIFNDFPQQTNRHEPQQRQLQNIYNELHENRNLPVPDEFKIINSLSLVNLKIKNQINDPGDANKKFDYTLNVRKYSDKTVENIKFDENGNHTFSLANDESFSVPLVKGMDYFVSQDDYSGENYITTHNDIEHLLYDSGIMEDNDMEHLFIQNYATFNIRVEKEVSGNMGDKSDKFDFIVEIFKKQETDIDIQPLLTKPDQNTLYDLLGPSATPAQMNELLVVNKNFHSNNPSYSLTFQQGDIINIFSNRLYQEILDSEHKGTIYLPPTHPAYAISQSFIKVNDIEVVSDGKVYNLCYTETSSGFINEVFLFNSQETTTYMNLEQFGGTRIDDLKYLFTLSHGENFSITGIPRYFEYKITETDESSAGYKTTINGVDTKTVSGELTEKDTVISVVNTVETAIPTGIETIKILPISIIIFTISLIFVKKRRKLAQN